MLISGGAKGHFPPCAFLDAGSKRGVRLFMTCGVGKPRFWGKLHPHDLIAAVHVNDLAGDGAAARASATSEYALTSCATRKASRLVFTNSPSSASFGANATECSSRCSLPNFLPVWSNTRAM